MSFPHRTLCHTQTGHCVIPKQDIVSFPNKTWRRSHTGHCVVPRQDIESFPQRTLCHLQTGQCVVAEQDIVSFLNRTMCHSCEDSSDFDDFWRKSIAASKKFSCRRKKIMTSERTSERATSERAKKFLSVHTECDP